MHAAGMLRYLSLLPLTPQETLTSAFLLAQFVLLCIYDELGTDEFLSTL